MPRTGPGTKEVLKGLMYEETNLRAKKLPPGSQLYLLPSCGAALRTLRWAPLGASVFLGDTPGHVHTVVQKHLLPYTAR